MEIHNLVILPSHTELLDDSVSQTAVIGKEFYELRKDHLKKLTKIEALIRQISPLPISYDRNRLHPPYFNEFTYNELLGCLYVSPQSVEASCQIIEKSVEDQGSFDVSQEVFLRYNNEGNLDKYKLQQTNNKAYKEIVFVPGINIFNKITSREVLSRLMSENEHVMIKLHPMTDEGLIRSLGNEFGFHRLLGPLESGSDYLKNCEVCHVTTCTEMGMYAMLMDKEVHNVGNFFTEMQGGFYPIYRSLWKLNKEDRKIKLKKILNSNISGFFHPDDPSLERKVKEFFDNAMETRQKNKPISYEYGQGAWSLFKKDPQ